ncbi:MAG: NEW3 domain-containing protein [Oricola sp.]
MTRKTRLFWGVLATCTLLSNAPAFAQSDSAGPDAARPHGFWLTTPAPDFTAGAGRMISVPLDIINDTEKPQRARFELSGVPDGWTWKLKGHGHELSSTMVAPGETGRVTLELTPPAGTAPKAYELDLKADYGNGTADLPMSLTISDEPVDEAKLEPELPALRGGVKSTFQYKMKLTNNGAEDALFNLAADVPPGFRTAFKKGYGSDEITGIPVKAGATENVTLEVKLDQSVPAGDYPIHVTTVAGDQKAAADLTLEVTGSPELVFRGPQDRLSGTAVAGKESSFAFKLENTGSAPAKAVKFNASAPSGWTVTFDPKELPELAPGETQDVNVTIKPTEKAIAGDYMVSLDSRAEGTSQNVRFRTTVETSTLFGLAGIGVIGAAVLVLALAVMRYGRR